MPMLCLIRASALITFGLNRGLSHGQRCSFADGCCVKDGGGLGWGVGVCWEIIATGDVLEANRLTDEDREATRDFRMPTTSFKEFTREVRNASLAIGRPSNVWSVDCATLLSTLTGLLSIFCSTCDSHKWVKLFLQGKASKYRSTIDVFRDWDGVGGIAGVANVEQSEH